MAPVGPKRRLVMFVVEPDPEEPADVIGDEPIWHDGAGRRLGHVAAATPTTAGCRWRWGYIPTELAEPAASSAGGSRSRSSASAARRACSSSPRSTPQGLRMRT